MRTVSLTDYQQLAESELPAELAAIPSMMSLPERQFLYHFTREHYRGDGCIVDGGAFLGASTACFGAGLAANPNADAIRAKLGKAIVTYEQGLVRENLQRTLQRNDIHFETGGSFIPALEQHIAPVARDIDLRVGDIMEQEWGNAPIELLYLDVLKTVPIQDHIFTRFVPALMTGGLLLQQDYFIDGMVGLKVKQEFLADHFEYVGEIYPMAVFRLTSPVPAEKLARTLADFPFEEQMALLERTAARTVDEDRKFFVELSKIHLLVRARKPETLARWEDVKARYPAQSSSESRRMKLALAKVERGLALVANGSRAATSQATLDRRAAREATVARREARQVERADAAE